MRSIDKVLRAQARALTAVLDHYKLVRACGGNRPPIWRDVEAFGTGSGSAVDLQSIGRNEAGTTAAALTVRVAALVVTLPTELVTTAVNRAPLSEVAVAGVV